MTNTIHIRRSGLIVAFGLVAVLTSGAAGKAQALLVQKQLSNDASLAVVQGALEKCHADGYRVSLSLLDSSGLVKIQVRGDGTGPHTLENSRRKAYTALTFKRPSGDTAKAWAAATTPPPVIEGTVGAQGGLPIKVGNEVIGAIGISGAPGGEKDEACAAAGIAKIADLLK
ncbi:MAG TPA: heme-binding protein [Acidobacteriaceae bacterium]|nr:heme-binding protein [Acidobacteriaceae bacterium]